MSDDQPLATVTAAEHQHENDLDQATYPKQLSVADILDSARLPEKRAHVCLRADLQAEYDALIAELGTLVNERGELVADPEASAADQSAESKARGLNDRIEAVRSQMADAMWHPLFRGMPSDEFAVFQREHYPTVEGADLTEYHNQIVARCAIDPVMTVDDVKALRSRIGFKAFTELIKAARDVCLQGGVDIPKSLGFSLTQTEQ